MTPMSYRARRAAKKARRKDPSHHVPPVARLASMPDPLLHRNMGVAAGATQTLGVAIGAVLMHGVALAVIFGAATVASKIGIKEDTSERIEVAVVNKPKPPEPPPPPVEAPPPEPPPPEPPKEKVKKPEPPPDPIDTPKEEPKEAPQEEAQPIVGLNQDSTVEGGEGPSFATGNTRMGQTDKVAKDAGDIKPLANAPVPKPAEKVVPPQPKRRIKPEYPERYLEMGIEGDVVVAIKIDENGRPTDVSIIKASEYAEFNIAAKRAALRDEFSPALRNGVAVPYVLKYKYNFRLDS